MAAVVSENADILKHRPIRTGLDHVPQQRLETRHIETALKMASVLGEMKGAAMKIGQMASFIDIDLLPPEVGVTVVRRDGQ